MKLKAIILVVFFFAYMAEILALSVSMNEPSAKVCKAQMNCAMMMKMKGKQQKSLYSIFITGYRYQYLSSSWKPPNMA